MRAITSITIRKETRTVTMFLTYNNTPSDYGFTNHPSEKEALKSLLTINDPYFPIKTKEYRFLEISGRTTILDEIRKIG